MEFERREVPAVVIATDVFEVLARHHLRSRGFGHVPVVVTANPIVYLSPQQLRDRAASLVETVVQGLTGGSTGE